jgi:hypothetical protein
VAASRDRWIPSLIALAESRGDAERVWRRAVDICRTLNIAPWIALGVAERLIPLDQATPLDRAARCKDLQRAVLDKRLALDALKTTLPYAIHLLAAELLEHLGRDGWSAPDALMLARTLLMQERRPAEAGGWMPVRQRPFADYLAAGQRARRLMLQHGCTLDAALDVETGLLDVKMLAARSKRQRLADQWRSQHPLEERGGAPRGRQQGDYARTPGSRNRSP